ncbi:MAG: RNA methyltransferase [Nanopusillaceae archaeon]
MLLIPSTFTGEKKDIKIRNFLISQVARAAVTFGINEIGVYYDRDPKFNSHGLGRYIVKILKYLNTPPYIRKFVFPLEKDLKEVGSCLPIKANYHLDRSRYVYVYVLNKEGNFYRVTDGKSEFKVYSKNNYKNKTLIYDKKRNKFVEKYETEIYFGYEVFYYNKPIEDLLKKLKKEDFFIIGTSKLGEDIRKVDLKIKSNVAIVFGSFARGFEDIWKNDFKKKFDIVINSVPNQLIESIRTEEAIYYTLALLRYKNII